MELSGVQKAGEFIEIEKERQEEECKHHQRKSDCFLCYKEEEEKK